MNEACHIWMSHVTYDEGFVDGALEVEEWREACE